MVVFANSQGVGEPYDADDFSIEREGRPVALECDCIGFGPEDLADLLHGKDVLVAAGPDNNPAECGKPHRDSHGDAGSFS